MTITVCGSLGMFDRLEGIAHFVTRCFQPVRAGTPALAKRKTIAPAKLT